MAEKKRILIFINTLEIGGSERVVSLLVRHLSNDFTIHLAMYSKIIEYEIPENTPILDLQQPARESRLKMFLKAPLLAKRVTAYCRENQIDTVVAFLYRPCFITAIMKSWMGFRGCLVMCERTHQTTLMKRYGPLLRLITRATVRFAYQRADLVLTNARAMHHDLINNLNITTPVRLINNPVDIAFINRQAGSVPDFAFEAGKFYFLTVGRFRKEKNYDMLIRAFALLKDPACRLIMVGGGEELEKCVQLARELGIAERVHFAGFQRNPFQYMARSQCFVLSSDVEGYPNVLLEALACGLPVISTDCNSGPVELLEPGFTGGQLETYHEGDYGILCPVNSPEVLAEAMQKALNDPGLLAAYRSRAKERAGDFNIEVAREPFKRVFSGEFCNSGKK